MRSNRNVTFTCPSFRLSSSPPTSFYMSHNMLSLKDREVWEHTLWTANASINPTDPHVFNHHIFGRVLSSDGVAGKPAGPPMHGMTEV